MFYPDYSEYEEHGSNAMSRNLLLIAIPIILCLAFVSGSIAFFTGTRFITADAVVRKAKLPVAGNRVEILQRQVSHLKPLVSIAAAATNPLAPITTTEKGNWIRIPALKVNVPLIKAKSMGDADVLEALTEGVALYPNGVFPGQKGNTFISGHSTGEPWKGPYRFAFMNISKLKSGDTILVDYEGSRYSYVITGSHIVNPQNIKTLDSSTNEPTISLMACWPLWTSKNRMIVDAKLVAINPLQFK